MHDRAVVFIKLKAVVFLETYKEDIRTAANWYLYVVRANTEFTSHEVEL